MKLTMILKKSGQRQQCHRTSSRAMTMGPGLRASGEPAEQAGAPAASCFAPTQRLPQKDIETDKPQPPPREC
jgi:hypothetical protein